MLNYTYLMWCSLSSTQVSPKVNRRDLLTNEANFRVHVGQDYWSLGLAYHSLVLGLRKEACWFAGLM